MDTLSFHRDPDLGPKALVATRQREIYNQLWGQLAQFYQHIDEDGRTHKLYPIVSDAQQILFPTIYAAINVLTTALSRAKLEVINSRTGEVIPNHHLNRLFRKPYRNWNRVTFWRYVHTRKLFDGSAYVQILRDTRNRPAELLPIVSAYPQYEAAPGQLIADIYYNNVKPYGVANTDYKVPNKDILAFHGPLFDGVSSPSPIRQVLKQVSILLSVIMTQSHEGLRHGFTDRKHFGIDPRFITALGDADSISELKESIAETEKKFKDEETAKKDKQLVLPVGVTSATHTSFNAQAYQLETFTRWMERLVLQAFQIPPRQLYIYAEGQRVEPKLGTQAEDFVNNSLRTVTEQYEDEGSDKLLSPQELNAFSRVNYNFDHLTHGTLEERLRIAGQATANDGLLGRDEGRRIAGYGPHPDGPATFQPRGAPTQTQMEGVNGSASE